MTNRPRICDILNINIGERFFVNGREYIIDVKGEIRDTITDDLISPIELLDVIDNPQLINKVVQLTKEEYKICEVLHTNYITKDKGVNSVVRLWYSMPMLNGDGYWICPNENYFATISDTLFPSLQAGQICTILD